MKWPKTPADLLSEKTFLVISNDLRILKENSRPREKGSESPRETVAASVAVTAESSCDTWPPKMRKKRPRKICEAMYENSDGEEPRPATANLEAPLVLDPRLVDKIDMSLLSKESLNASLTRISLIKTVTILESPPTPKGTETVTKNNNYNQPWTKAKLKTRCSTTSPTRNGRKNNADSSESDTRTSNETSSSSEAKKLDDNNNKNKQQQQQLSPLRSRSSRSTASSSASRSKKASPTRTAPEACKECGRAAQPERFHTHPAKESLSTSSTTLLGSSRSAVSVIPVRATGRGSRKPSARVEDKRLAVHSPITSPRSEQPTSLASATSTTEGEMSSEEASKKERKLSLASISKSSEHKSAASTVKRGPRSVTCYICGREFGSASFPIHEPKCLQKWHRENKALPNSQRRNIPQRPNVPPDHEDWNVAAWEESQAQLVPCPKCKRTFFPDRLAVHERNCRVSNKVFY